jgi:hypothetical protein
MAFRSRCWYLATILHGFSFEMLVSHYHTTWLFVRDIGISLPYYMAFRSRYWYLTTILHGFSFEMLVSHYRTTWLHNAQKPNTNIVWSYNVILHVHEILICVFTADGVTYSFGVFYLNFVDYFNEGKGATAWIASILVGVTLCSGQLNYY